jgi:hypothetical protein
VLHCPILPSGDLHRSYMIGPLESDVDLIVGPLQARFLPKTNTQVGSDIPGTIRPRYTNKRTGSNDRTVHVYWVLNAANIHVNDRFKFGLIEKLLGKYLFHSSGKDRIR